LLEATRYIKLLLWPLFLCYDYSMDAVPLVESLTDARPGTTHAMGWMFSTVAMDERLHTLVNILFI
jgi:hypothetical protein